MTQLKADIKTYLLYSNVERQTSQGWTAFEIQGTPAYWKWGVLLMTDEGVEYVDNEKVRVWWVTETTLHIITGTGVTLDEMLSFCTSLEPLE